MTDANLQICRKGSVYGSDTLWERNGLHSRGNGILTVYSHMRNASRKSHPDIIPTTTKEGRSKPSNIIAQTRVKREETAER